MIPITLETPSVEGGRVAVRAHCFVGKARFFSSPR